MSLCVCVCVCVCVCSSVCMYDCMHACTGAVQRAGTRERLQGQRAQIRNSRKRQWWEDGEGLGWGSGRGHGVLTQLVRVCGGGSCRGALTLFVFIHARGAIFDTSDCRVVEAVCCSYLFIHVLGAM